MALSAKQRAKLPPSAFVYPPGTAQGGKNGKYPVPTRAQAAKIGLSEKERLATLRNALSRAGQGNTAGTYQQVAKKVQARAGGKIESVKKRK